MSSSEKSSTNERKQRSDVGCAHKIFTIEEKEEILSLVDKYNKDNAISIWKHIHSCINKYIYIYIQVCMYIYMCI